MENSSSKLVIFDIDGTLLPEQSQFLLLKYLRKNKIVSITYFTRLYFWFALYKMGVAKDPVKVFQYAIKFLENKSEAEAEEVIDNFVRSEIDKHLFTDMVELLDKHKDKGERVLLLSNAMDVLVSSIAKHLQVKEYIGTELEVGEYGFFTGKLATGITYGNAKIVKLELYLGNDKAMISKAMCYTDHHSDVPLLDTVLYPIVVNPTSTLEHIAKDRQWKIIRPE